MPPPVHGEWQKPQSVDWRRHERPPASTVRSRRPPDGLRAARGRGSRARLRQPESHPDADGATARPGYTVSLQRTINQKEAESISNQFDHLRVIWYQPFNFDEWAILIEHIPEWYRPYFEFAVQTGLRPSEQVALKWSAIDDEYIHIELSRVRNHDKDDLKTHESRRRIQLRPTLKHILEQQRELTKQGQSPYVFINNYGRPILQDKLREIWVRAICKTSLTYRRMYETRHTFASWAHALGETPEWVARTLGHVDTSMVYKTYGR